MSPLFVVGPAVCGLVVAITSAVLIQALGIDAVGDGLLFGAIVGVGYLFADTVDVHDAARRAPGPRAGQLAVHDEDGKGRRRSTIGRAIVSVRARRRLSLIHISE